MLRKVTCAGRVSAHTRPHAHTMHTYTCKTHIYTKCTHTHTYTHGTHTHMHTQHTCTHSKHAHTNAHNHSSNCYEQDIFYFHKITPPLLQTGEAVSSFNIKTYSPEKPSVTHHKHKTVLLIPSSFVLCTISLLLPPEEREWTKERGERGERERREREERERRERGERERRERGGGKGERKYKPGLNQLLTLV